MSNACARERGQAREPRRPALEDALQLGRMDLKVTFMPRRFDARILETPLYAACKDDR